MGTFDIRALNPVDFLFLAVILFGIWGGWRRGFLLGAAQLLPLAAAVAVVLLVYRDAAALLARQGWVAAAWAPPLAFLLVLVVALAVFGVLARRLVRLAPPAVHGNTANKLLGLLPGTASGLLHAFVLATLLVAVPLGGVVTRQVRESLLADRLGSPAEWMAARLGPVFDPVVGRMTRRMTVEPAPDESLTLPYTVKDAPPRPDLEASMLLLLNQERSARGLPLLQADAEAVEVARAHSRDMFARGYFSHQAPDGADPFERMRRARLRFAVAGENLALSRNLGLAHQGLMNSPGHRANILRPAFGRVGIVDGGRHGLMVTQTFRN